MLMQYVRDKFSREGMQQGIYQSLTVLFKAKFGTKGLKSLQSGIKNIADKCSYQNGSNGCIPLRKC